MIGNTQNDVFMNARYLCLQNAIAMNPGATPERIVEVANMFFEFVSPGNVVPFLAQNDSEIVFNPDFSTSDPDFTSNS